MFPRKRRPTTPGEILKEHYLTPRNISVSAFARAVGCSRKHMSDIVHGRSRIEAHLAARVARVLDTTARLWLNLQTAVDVYDAEQELKDWEPDRLYRAG